MHARAATPPARGGLRGASLPGHTRRALLLAPAVRAAPTPPPPPGDRPDDPPLPGDGRVQDNLAAMLRLQVGAEEVKQLVAREEEKLIASAERIKAEAEAMAAENAAAREAALDAALENINRLADEAEAELAARRAVIDADRAALAAFEEETAEARSAGLFFRGLHTPDKEEEKGGASPSPPSNPPPNDSAASRMRAALARLPGDVADAGAGVAAAAARTGEASSSSSSSRPDPASAIVQAASSEVRSSLRYGVWLVLCIATGGVAIIDLFSVEPAFGADAAALGMAAWLGWSAAAERGAVDEAAGRAAARAREREGEGR